MSRARRTQLDPYAEALARVRAERARRQHEAAQSMAAVRGEEIKAGCERLTGFVRWAWPILEPGTEYVPNWHIDAVSEHLEAITTHDIQNLAVNIPPGTMKSLLISVFFPAWWWTKAPTKRFLSGSHEQTLALRDNEKMRALVVSPEYQALWGEKTRLIKTGTRSFMNVSRGGREARAFKSMTGGRGDATIIDDPHSTETAESDKEREKAVRRFVEGIQNRVNDAATSSIILVMQRLHDKDVTGAIDRYGFDYEKLVLPMEFEPKRRFTTRIGWTDPRQAEGDLLFPGKFPRAEVEKLKKIGSYAWAGQYQQRPVPREGGLFKREWFAGKVMRPGEVPAGVVWWRHWDLAATELDPMATTGARTCGVKMGRAPDGRIIVGHMNAFGKDGKVVKVLIRQQAEIDGTGVSISVPQDPGAGGKVNRQDIINHLEGFVARKMIESGDKVTRAEPFSAACENGDVWLVQGSWNDEYLDELCSFPSGARKDVADASSGAYARLVSRMARRRGDDLAAPKVIPGAS